MKDWLDEMEADISSLTEEELSVEEETHLPVEQWIEKMLS